MKYKVKRVHFVGKGGTDTSRMQGPAAPGAAGCDRPRAAAAADRFVRIDVDVAA